MRMGTLSRSEDRAADANDTTTARAPASSRERRGAPARRRRLAIAVGLADVRHEPDAASELVTQARLWTEAEASDERDGWIRVRLPDYDGWVRGEDLKAPPRQTSPWVAVVTAPSAPVFAGAKGTHQLVAAPITTVLPLRRDVVENTERPEVRLPGGHKGWMRREDVAVRDRARPFPPGGPPAALQLAHELLGTPYVWGGTSPRGIDCSGLAQLCYRQAGCALPRDADQQFAAVAYIVERGDLRPGDLIFFAEQGEIDHVGIALGGARVLNARMSASKVVIDALDPGEPDYSPRLASMYAGARRPMPEWAEGAAPDRGEPA
jgi:cell wall-associated NlpC family hydrolase